MLGGRGWRLVHLDWDRREAYVEPIELPGRSLWLGTGLPLRFALCQAQKRVLLGAGDPALLTRRAVQQLEEIRARFPWLEKDATLLEPTTPGRARWWTFAGLKANATLADHLARNGCPILGRDNLAITLDVTQGMPLLEALRPSPEEAERLTPQSLADDALESLKFGFCTPEDLCIESLRARLADPAAVRAILSMTKVFTATATH